jgi:signal transduction histidine kinase
MPLSGAASSAARAHDAVKRHRFRHAFEFMAAALLDDKESGDLTLHSRCYNDRTRVGQSLGSRRDVGHVAEYLPGRVDYHRTQVDGDASSKRLLAGTLVLAVQFGERTLHGQRCPDRPLGIVLLRHRVGEQRHQPVAKLLGNFAAHFHDRSRGRVQKGANQIAPFFSIELRSDACRVHQIAEHHRHVPSLASGFGHLIWAQFPAAPRHFECASLAPRPRGVAMRRHSKKAREPVARGRKTIRKRRNSPKLGRRRSSFAAHLARLTRELGEAREQQAATAEVLKVIGRSTFALKTVLTTLTESAARLCAADMGLIFQQDGDVLRPLANFGISPEAKRYWLAPEPIDRGTTIGRAQLEGRAIHIPDVLADLEYRATRDQVVVGYRTTLAVPLLHDGTTIGIFALGRREPNPFTGKQIELVTTFADQAVIAIENARLLNELRARTDQLADSVHELQALGEVSQAVNSTLDLETVLSTIVAKAAQLSGTEAGAIYVFDNAQREFYLRATYGMDQELIEALTQRRIGLDDPNVQEALAQPEPTQFADLKDELHTELNEITLRAGFRARLTAPLIRGEDLIGLLVVRRHAPGEFATNTVDLIKTFAAQSAVAIQNARLFENVDTRTRELAKSLEDLRTAQDRLIQTEKLASLGQLTAGIAHEIKNPLNFVNNFSGVSVELIDELQQVLEPQQLDSQARAQVTELTNTLRENLEKVVQHGKRADAIVKNMLLHSREGSGERRPIDVNNLVEESLNLAYHGARAEKRGFTITLERSFDPSAGEIDVFPQEITRVLLNVISNGFHAATKRDGHATSNGFGPTLKATTKNFGDRVEITIRDNGDGIPPGVLEKMFNPFFTTKPAGEGTGLGLSISHDIIVKQHAGSIEVDTQPGEFAEFKIILPRNAASLVGPQRPRSAEISVPQISLW